MAHRKEIYLDNASQAKVLPIIKDNIMRDLQFLCNPNSAHSLGALNRMKIEQTRTKVADYIGARNKEQIIFTPNATCATALAFNDFNVKCGEFEHPNLLKNALSWPWVNDNYDMLSISLVNGEDGSVNEVKRGKEKFLHSDLTSAIPILPINVEKMDLDFASFSGTKIGALPGVGVLYAKDKELLLPLVEGSNSQEFGFAGTQNTLSIISLGYAIDYLTRHRIEYYNRCLSLGMKLAEELDSISDTVHSIPLNDMERTYVPNIWLVAFANATGEALQNFLSLSGIYVGLGTACNGKNTELTLTIEKYNLPDNYKKGILRFSFGYDTEEEDIIRTVEVIKKFFKLHPKGC